SLCCFFFQAEDGIRDFHVTGVQTCALPISEGSALFAGVEDQRFYFVHSFGVRRWVLDGDTPVKKPLVTWTEYGGDRFVSAVEHRSEERRVGKGRRPRRRAGHGRGQEGRRRQ